ncbi:MAG: hypothetical protein A2284_16980 [Deltaproteobacteria bacterium RIFOXYA12_FULL_61_11]|nr:MAG: hypothetical protein A2284_16980 [Deltaproteobacteria bacterium RIFOXYA12_FULL_61_11]
MAERRIVIYAQDEFGGRFAKTALSLLRYPPGRILGVVDRSLAGRRVGDLWSHGSPEAPIKASLDDFLPEQPDLLILGVAPRGGSLPTTWITDLVRALDLGLEIWNGLHHHLLDVPDIAAAAARNGGKVWDTRRHSRTYPVGTCRALDLPCTIVLTVGSDCALGKMTAALELTFALQRLGVNARFLPTGQTGMMIAGYGLAVDSVVSDFVSGAVETLLLEEHRDAEVLVVEGQGGIHHPGYGAVTLGLLHGTLPHYLLFCHEPSRLCCKDTQVHLPELETILETYVDLLSHLRVPQYLGFAVNGRKLAPAERESLFLDYRRRFGLPVYDPLVDGSDALAAELVRRMRAK